MPGKQIKIDWLAGFSNSSAQYLEASAHDTLSFEWSSGSHNVYYLRDQEAFDNCNFSGAHLLGDISPMTLELTSFQSGHPNMHYFACNVPRHCNSGQKLAVSTGDIKF